MSLLDKPTDSVPTEPDPHRQSARRSKEARAARAVERAAAKAAGVLPEPRPAGPGRQPRQRRSAEAGRGRGATTSTAVNLLSPWVLEELKVHHLRRKFVGGALALLLVLGAIGGALQVRLGNVQDALAEQEAASSALQAQINELADVKVYVGNVALRATDVEEVMSTDVDLSDVLAKLLLALPEGKASFDTLAIHLNNEELSTDPSSAGSEDTVCPGPDPFGTTEVVGCVELTGVAQSRADVSTLVQTLADSKLFVEPFITTTTIGENAIDAAAQDMVAFGGSVGLDPQALAGRFVDLDGSGPAPDETEDGS